MAVIDTIKNMRRDVPGALTHRDMTAGIGLAHNLEFDFQQKKRPWPNLHSIFPKILKFGGGVGLGRRREKLFVCFSFSFFFFQD